jgi:hypothetical protein
VTALRVEVKRIPSLLDEDTPEAQYRADNLRRAIGVRRAKLAADLGVGLIEVDELVHQFDSHLDRMILGVPSDDPATVPLA